MMFKISIIAAALAVIVNAAATTTTSHTSTSTPATTTTHTSVVATPTFFNIIARNSGTQFDGKKLSGTDQSFTNATFGTIESDDYPSTKIYLEGPGQSPRLKGTTGYEMWGGYHGSVQNPGNTDSSQAWAFFGGDDFSLYGYTQLLCSAVQQKSGKFHLICSLTASDNKVVYKRPMIDGSGELSYLPSGSALPSGYKFVQLEIQKLPGSAPTSIPPCCP